MKPLEQDQKFRADLPAWFFIVGLSAFPWLIFWVNSANKVDWLAFFIAVAISVFTLAWVACFQIVITPGELIFSSLFHGRQHLKHSEIKLVSLTWKFWQTKKGPMRLVVEPHDVSGKKRLDINAKVFSRKAIDAVLELGARVAKADDGGLRDGIVSKSLKKLKSESKINEQQ